MSEYIINDDWVREYERNIEELIGFDLEYDSATNPTPPLHKVDGTRYFELFGTPERAARTLADNCDDYNLCGGCSADCESHDCYDALLEWLRGDA